MLSDRSELNKVTSWSCDVQSWQGMHHITVGAVKTSNNFKVQHCERFSPAFKTKHNSNSTKEPNPKRHPNVVMKWEKEVSCGFVQKKKVQVLPRKLSGAANSSFCCSGDATWSWELPSDQVNRVSATFKRREPDSHWAYMSLEVRWALESREGRERGCQAGLEDIISPLPIKKVKNINLYRTFHVVF